MKIKVSANVQLVHAGKHYTLGDTADVSDNVAQEWIKQGWASEVKPKTSPRKK